MDNLFSTGSVVSIQTGLLFHNNDHFLNDLKYNGRDHVYGVVMECNPEHKYIISWLMTGLNGISKEAETSHNVSSYKESDLCLIVINTKDYFDTVTLQGAPYLTHFFRYHKVEHMWVIYGWDEDCN